MLDPEIGLAGPYSEKAAHKPAAGVARVERERAVDQADHRTNVLAEPGQHLGGIGEDARVVLPGLKRLPVQPTELPGFTDAITQEGDVRTLPSMGADGFYIARLKNHVA